MQKKTVTFYKNSLLVFALLLGTFSSCFGDIKSTAKSWLPTPVYTALKKYFFLQPKHEKFAQKYEKEKHKTIIEDPIQSAAAFAQAIKNNTAIDPKLKNNHHLFLLGASSSAYQVEGGLDEFNATAQFNKNRNLPMAEDAIDFLNRYETDIPQIEQDLGINAIRISIAWERIQPTANKWDENAITRYINIIKRLKAHNIEPIVVFHHYTIPTWFAKLGGFEKTANNIYFVEFGKKMYGALHKDVTYWSTFNAIEGYAFKGYYQADNPPGEKNLQKTLEVMANMLKAHVDIYQAIKGKKGMYTAFKNKDNSIPNPQIGIQKNIVPLDAYNKTWKNTISLPISKIFTYMGETAQNSGFFSFFTTGIFYTWLPTKAYVKTDYNPDARSSLDWIGVNIYSNMYMLWSQRQEETVTDRQTANINYRDYPEGIYRAVETINKNIAQPLNIPIIITENGIATNNDEAGNAKRTRFFQRTLFTIRKLLKENYNIIGYTPWACHDNYEWPSVEQPDPWNSRRYGFFYVNFDKNSPDYLKRTLKQGSYYYANFVKAFFNA
jgi:beta-glucosidase